MAYPCFVCGEETGASCLCPDCEPDIKNSKLVVNGKWCPGHQIIHWRGEPCPLCKRGQAPKGILSLLHSFREACEQVGYCSNLDDDDELRIEAWGNQAETFLKIKKLLGS